MKEATSEEKQEIARKARLVVLRMRTSQIPHATGAVSFVFEDETLRIFLDYVSEPYIVVTEKLPTSRSFVLEARWDEHCWTEHLGEPEVLQASITDDSKWVAHLDELYEKALHLPVQEEEAQAPQAEDDPEDDSESRR